MWNQHQQGARNHVPLLGIMSAVLDFHKVKVGGGGWDLAEEITSELHIFSVTPKTHSLLINNRSMSFYKTSQILFFNGFSWWRLLPEV